MNLPIPQKLQPIFHYGMIALSITPQILFAVGSVYPPAAAWAIALQNLMSAGGLLQPAVIQSALAGVGAVGLRNSDAPKP